MKLSQEQENLLKFVPSVEVRAKIRSYMKSLIKDIERTYKLTNELGWKWRMEKDRRKARKELYQIEKQLINNYSIQQSKKEKIAEN